MTTFRRSIGALKLAAVFAMLTACADHEPEDSGPPLAERRPHVVIAPAGQRSDPYHWIRDDERTDPQVLELLNAENRYTQVFMSRLAPLVSELGAEMQSRIPDTQQGAPFLDGGYWYYERFVDGAEHPIYARRKDADHAAEEILLDGNRMANEASLFRIGRWDVSPDGNRLLWMQDRVGRRQFHLLIRDLGTGKETDTGISGVSSAVWSVDGRSVLFVENHPETLRAFRVRRFDPDLGTITTLYEEADPAFSASVGRTRSDRYDYVHLQSWTSTEMRVFRDPDPAAAPEVFAPRREGHEYRADHVGNHWVVRTNFDAPNFRLMLAPDQERADPGTWAELVAHREDVYIEEVDPFDSFVAWAERSNGLRRIRILGYGGTDQQVVEFDEPVHVVQLGRNPDPSRRSLQFVYTSPTTPQTTWELNLDTGQRDLLNRLEVGGSFEPSNYRVRRVWAEARDGARVPVSLSWHKDTALDGSAPLLQTGYGAYGTSHEAAFSSERLSLLDRGVIHAIAHVRGGQELGRDWYEQGRLLSKQNSFTDFIDVTRHLVDEDLVDADRVFAEGSSAGGLLVGGVANMAADRYAGIIARVPFVDVVTTMLDESIPLTTFEFAEWGNPMQPEHYEYMLEYSPYDNVESKAYPAMWVTAALWDSQVQYWEPVKWVARLRHRRTDSNPVLLKVDLEAGHNGHSGRFQRLEARAQEYAFLLDQAGLVP